MKPETILKLDRWIGGPACRILTLLERCRRLFCRVPDGPRRIVFVKLIEMGSTILACPAFAEAERRVGRGNLFFLVFRPNKAILDLIPFFPDENVIVIDDSSLLTFARDLLRAMRRLRRERVDTAIDLEGLTRSSAIITWLTGATRRVGYHNFTSEGPYRGRLFTHELNYNFQHHVSRSFLALVRASFLPPGQVPMLKEPINESAIVLPSFTPSEADIAAVKNILAGETGHPVTGPLILLNPNCSDLLPLRQWPIESFIDLGRRVLAEWPAACVAVTGAPAERDAAEAAVRQIGSPDRAVCMAGRTTLRQLLTLYHLGTALVSNDSGPCHFAALTRIPVIALFGPETPILYAPLGVRVTVVSAGLACSPCVNMLNHRFSPCHDNRCMRDIGVEDVYRPLAAILRSHS